MVVRNKSCAVIAFGKGDPTMKQMTKKLTMVLALVFVVILMFSVVGSAAEVAPEEEKSDLSIDSLIERAKTELCGAPYIGEYCQEAFNFIDENAEYQFVVFGVLSLIMCFFGYRLLRIVLFFGGLFAGFVGGLILTPQIANVIPGMPDFMPLVIGGICAIVAALLLHFFFKWAILLGVGFAAFKVSAFYLKDMEYALLYRILVAVACAILAFLIIRFFFVMMTALLGGIFAMTQLLSRVDVMQTVLYENETVFGYTEIIGVNSLTVAVVIGLVVALLGIIFQFMNTRKRRA
jgi:hypothetical protein